VDIAVEGPYGHLSIDLFNMNVYSMIVLIGGGIGITPIFSLHKELRHSRTSDARSNLKKVIVAWSVRDVETARGCYNDQFHTIEEGGGGSLGPFEYHFNITSLKTDDALRRVRGDLPHSSLWKAGRVDYPSMFTEIRSFAQSNQIGRVAVVVSGPFQLIAEVRDLTSKACGDGPRFDVHEEYFSF
jgi:hypothetical protein